MVDLPFSRSQPNDLETADADLRTDTEHADFTAIEIAIICLLKQGCAIHKEPDLVTLPSTRCLYSPVVSPGWLVVVGSVVVGSGVCVVSRVVVSGCVVSWVVANGCVGS
jgi:hypothetical protein